MMMEEEEEEVGPPGDHGQRTTGHHRHTISLTMYNRGDNITYRLHDKIKLLVIYNFGSVLFLY